jgi:hypothetical protein
MMMINKPSVGLCRSSNICCCLFAQLDGDSPCSGLKND